MRLDIIIKGDTETNEYKDAQDLKSIFERDLPPGVTGKILIISNATLFGQAVKDVDLVVVGHLENYDLQFDVPARKLEKNKFSDLPSRAREISIKNFCFVIETKRQSSVDIRLEGTNIVVNYDGKPHDVTSQSEKQKYSLKNFLSSNLPKSPYICNFIWFRSLNDITNLFGGSSAHNVLQNNFHVTDLFKLACNQNPPFVRDSNILSGYFSSMKNLNLAFNSIEKVFNLFERNIQAISDLTRKKIESVTRKLLNKQNYAKAIGESLVVISGRAGTGKTIKLLSVASDLATYNHSRCLILTYNYALASDIKRMLALARYSDAPDTYTVSIETIYKFIRKLIIGFGIESEARLNNDYIDRYDNYLEELYQFIKEGLISNSDIQDLMKRYHETISWDYILIDESQDWKSKEKEVLYKIFGFNKIIVADGVDQLVRSQVKCDWTKNLSKEQFTKTYEKKSLRQKDNLLNFVNQYANQSNIEWDLESEKEINGGKVIIINGEYDFNIHNNEFKRLVEHGNSAYEMLFLIPPSLVNKERVLDRNGKERVKSSFSLIEKFEENGIKIWDGTNKDLRNEYPIDLIEHRVLQYDSCRGLEGWTVVCLELDEFINYKFETFENENIVYDNILETEEERRDKFVNLWSLIPLTRAIDTLIITIKNKDSLLAKRLFEIYEKNDFIQWIETV